MEEVKGEKEREKDTKTHTHTHTHTVMKITNCNVCSEGKEQDATMENAASLLQKDAAK